MMHDTPTIFRGTVAHGDKRGRVLGFLTANLNSPLPGMGCGVYASQTQIAGEGKVWPSVTSSGTRPTFDGADQRIETPILDFQGDLYGRDIEVRLIAFIRQGLGFSSVDELIAAIQGDIEQVRALARPS
jgi:riboflavin kinase / FMN adenylyltransferase